MRMRNPTQIEPYLESMTQQVQDFAENAPTFGVKVTVTGLFKGNFAVVRRSVKRDTPR
jgi:hypothetical protein